MRVKYLESIRNDKTDESGDLINTKSPVQGSDRLIKFGQPWPLHVYTGYWMAISCMIWWKATPALRPCLSTWIHPNRVATGLHGILSYTSVFSPLYSSMIQHAGYGRHGGINKVNYHFKVESWNPLDSTVCCPLIRMCGAVWAHMMGRRVAASRLGTICVYPKAGDWDVSTIPKTHTSLVVALPRWF